MLSPVFLELLKILHPICDHHENELGCIRASEAAFSDLVLLPWAILSQFKQVSKAVIMAFDRETLGPNSNVLDFENVSSIESTRNRIRERQNKEERDKKMESH